jgi:hypothetical protein
VVLVRLDGVQGGRGSSYVNPLSKSSIVFSARISVAQRRLNVDELVRIDG